MRRGGRMAGEDGPAARRFGHAAHAERPGDGHVPQVRQRGEAVGVGNAGAGDRPVERRHQILHRAFEPLDERRRHAVRPGGDANRLGRQVEAVGIGRVHPAIDVEQRRAHAVHRDLDLFRRFRGVQGGAAVAVERAGGLVIERDAEAVVAVRGERVLDREPAARAERGAFHLLALRHPAWHVEGDLAGRGAPVTDRQPADLRGGGQVRLHQGGREQLRVGDVVEVRALRIERQVVAGIDVERQQIADRLRILGPIQPLERPSSRRYRLGLVHLRFERLGERGQHGRIGAAAPGRRHLPGPELANHLLGGVAIGGGVVNGVTLEREVAGLGAVAVTSHAGAGNYVLRRCRLSWRSRPAPRVPALRRAR